MIFYRGSYQEIWITLESNESLGILDTQHLEDYYGVDGQVSLKNVTTGVRYPVLMNPQSAIIPNTSFVGVYNLNSIPDGDYTLEGRVRDIVGNYTVLSDFYINTGSQTIQYNLSIVAGHAPIVTIPVNINGFRIQGGYILNTPLRDFDKVVIPLSDTESGSRFEIQSYERMDFSLKQVLILGMKL
jgi:hypothetical protein